MILDIADVPHPDCHEVHNLQHFFIAGFPDLGKQFSWHFILDHFSPLAEGLQSLLAITLSVAKPLSQVHLVEEFQAIEVELGPAFADFVNVELVDHIVQR